MKKKKIIIYIYYPSSFILGACIVVIEHIERGVCVTTTALVSAAPPVHRSYYIYVYMHIYSRIGMIGFYLRGQVYIRTLRLGSEIGIWNVYRW